MPRLILLFLTAILILGMAACSQKSTTEVLETTPPPDPGNPPPGDPPPTGRITIRDRTGKVWDITHAVQKYNMTADGFQFGLGPNAIQPINNPRFFAPGDAGYPDPNSTFLIIGIRLNGDARAYPISVMDVHEVANDVIGGLPVAVGY